MNLVHRLRNPGFRNVSEPLSQCHLFHSNPLHSTLLHSATLSSETLQNNYVWALWFEKSLYLWCVWNNVKSQCRKTSCQETFLKPRFRGAAEKHLSFACLPSHQNVTKQNMFWITTLINNCFVMFPNFAARACARNAEPGNVSELLSRHLLLGLLISLYGNMKKRFAP